jgi:hypothetical protein
VVGQGGGLEKRRARRIFGSYRQRDNGEGLRTSFCARNKYWVFYNEEWQSQVVHTKDTGDVIGGRSGRGDGGMGRGRRRMTRMTNDATISRGVVV